MPRSSITAQSVAARLRQEICSGSLAPGSALRQEAVAADFGVSRMPVRDAIQMLQGEGLVHVLPNRGAFVASMTQAECAELFDLRVLLECDALAHAVPRHTDGSLRKLKRLQRDLEEETETTAWAEGDRLFHDALYAPCARARTLQMIATLRNAVERFYLAKLTHDTHRRGWKAEHRRVLDAVAAGDAARACERLREHLRETQAVVARAL